MATIKQRKRIKIIGKNRTTEQELLEAGYAPSTARKQPPSVTKARGWQELLEEHLPDDLLLGKHKEALDATKQDQYTGEITADHAIRLRATELGYKVKKRLGEQNVNIYGDKVIAILGGKTTEDVQGDNSDQ